MREKPGDWANCLGEILQRRQAQHIVQEKSDDWANRANCLEKFLRDGKLSIWASAKVRECHSEVKQEDEGRLSVLFRARKEAVQLVVCGLRRPVRLGSNKLDFEHARLHEPPNGQSF